MHDCMRGISVISEFVLSHHSVCMEVVLSRGPLFQITWGCCFRPQCMCGIVFILGSLSQTTVHVWKFFSLKGHCLRPQCMRGISFILGSLAQTTVHVWKFFYLKGLCLRPQCMHGISFILGSLSQTTVQLWKFVLSWGSFSETTVHLWKFLLSQGSLSQTTVGWEQMRMKTQSQPRGRVKGGMKWKA